jgi:gamma-glutamyltranspeptidase / glutathione hydrolase
MFVKRQDRTAHRRVGVPGTVRGLALAHQRFGRVAWKSLVMPAIGLARDGFALDAATAASLNEILAEVDPTEFGEFQRVYSKPDGRAWRDGDRLEQPDLAATLDRIARDGADAFYEGIIASQIAAEMLHGGGLITQADLQGYRAKFREPVRGSYRGFEIIAAPPSTSGGTTLTEMLNILENFDLRSHGRFAPETLHLLVEAARRAYRDRACYLGDPEFVRIPDTLIRKDYARTLAAAIDRRRATRSRTLAGDIQLSESGAHTTQVSVIDSEGTAVSMTYTLENMYGSRVVVRGAGFLLNDEMNDFNWLPGVTDESGRIGTPPNEVMPGKRMLSSMCPTVLLRDGKPYLITGSPGGRTIINTVLDMVINVVDFQMQPREAVDVPRMHHQWFPDRVKVERRLAQDYPAAIAGLRAMGHDVEEEKDTQGDAHSIWFDARTGRITAVADKREDGCAAGY